MSERNHARIAPFVLLGQTRRCALERRLTDVLTSWKAQWSTSSCSVRVEVPEAGGERSAVPRFALSLFASCPERGPLLVLDASADLLTELIDGAPPPAALISTETLVHQLLDEILRSLCSALLGPANACDVVVTASDDVSAVKDAVSWAAARVSVGRVTHVMGLLFHASAVESLVKAPRSSPPANEMTTRRGAVLEEIVRVEAILGSAEATLGDLASLAEGHVLLLDRHLDDLCTLTTSTGDHVARVSLGRAGEHRAVRVVLY